MLQPVTKLGVYTGCYSNANGVHPKEKCRLVAFWKTGNISLAASPPPATVARSIRLFTAIGRDRAAQRDTATGPVELQHVGRIPNAVGPTSDRRRPDAIGVGSLSPASGPVDLTRQPRAVYTLRDWRTR